MSRMSQRCLLLRLKRDPKVAGRFVFCRRKFMLVGSAKAVTRVNAAPDPGRAKVSIGRILVKSDLP